jgi:HEPN domain-containing protein
VKELMDNPDLTHIASFHVQQAIEKSMKAVLEKIGGPVQKTHNLEKLHSLTEDYIPVENHKLLMMINELYIDSRYPGDFGILPDGKPTQADVNEFYSFAHGIFNSARNTLEEP